MKKRLFFQVSYDGTNYGGWQKQPNAPTIQAEIEKRLTQLCHNQEVNIVGCGRTDAGVHAKQAFFHVDLEDSFLSEELHFKLNNMLPSDIAIDNLFEVDQEAHARFDATKRTYQYFIHHKKLPFDQNFSYYFPRLVSIQKMNAAAQYLLGKQDFTSFSKLHTDVNNNFCEIYTAEWIEIGEQLQFEISANRFLRNMVRAIVGTLLEIGLGNIEVEEMKEIIAIQDRGKAGFSVPARGLFLAEVNYPYIS